MQKTRSYNKVKIPQEVMEQFIQDSNKYLNKRIHYTKSKIACQTYKMLMETGECRSDVLDKIEKHLRKNIS